MKRLIKGPRKLWAALRTRGGLDLKYHADMDGGFLTDFAKALGVPPSQRAINAAIAEPGLTTEQFVGALMTALGPFSRMMADLLALFERVGARTTEASLKIEFDFKNAPKLQFDLNSFRDWMNVLEKVRQLTTVRTWTSEELWRLLHLLESPDEQVSWDTQMGAAGTPAERWAIEYLRNGGISVVELPEPSSGDAELDAFLQQARSVWSTIVAASASIAQTREQLRAVADGEMALDAGDGGWPPELLQNLHSDLWPATMIGRVYHLADYARRDQGFALDATRRLRELFDSIPSMTTQEDRLIESLLDFLNLPAWKKRHELYSAWVFTLIARALDPHTLRIHHDGGRLSFAFGGSHLATEDRCQPKLHVWAELRSPLPKKSRLSGRVKMQPDYSLVADPITGRGSAVAVVEVKQYREFAKANFSHAVIDYATGRPKAAVLLASYGPANSKFLRQVPVELASRIRIFGDLRPTDEIRCTAFCDELRDAVRRWYDATSAAPSVSAVRIPVAEAPSRRFESVKLQWQARPRDLDLHLALSYEGQWSEVNFRTKGSSNDYPWADLDADQKSGHGPETITIAKVLDAIYRCVVVNYSEDGPLSGSGAIVTLHYDGTAITIGCPSQGEGTFWHVFDLDGRTGRIEVVNRITAANPLPEEITPAASSR